MAGSKVNDYNIGDSNIQSVMLTLDKAYKGFHQVSLTNYDNTSESQVAAGSVIENNGGLYKFDSNESISGSPTDGTVYVRVVPSGDSATLEYTNTAPTWSDSKQGWYGTGGDANKRYIEFVIYKSGISWNRKESLFLGSRMNPNESFLYTTNGTQVLAQSTSNYVKFQNKIFDYFGSGGYNPSTGVFTPPSKGVYLVEVVGLNEIFVNNSAVSIHIRESGSPARVIYLFYYKLSTALNAGGEGNVFYLGENQTFVIDYYTDAAGRTVNAGASLLIKKIA